MNILMTLLLLQLTGLMTTYGMSVNQLRAKTAQIAEQLLRLQFYVEEQRRIDGHSGIESMRIRGEGTRPYHATHHADDITHAAIHDHSDFITTLGMGEIEAVLNGVEFRTRHNDYLFAKKSTNSTTFGATQIMDYPAVPPSVLSKNTVAKQIKEMKQYFKAWKEQDTSIRSDYKDYFKANLCYLEGAWIKADPNEQPKAFDNPRHHLDASSWDDLFQKTRFSSYSGTKSNLENYAYLPTTLWDYDPVTMDCTFGQWNYTMLCHPLKDDLPTNRLRAVDDLKTRMSTKLTFQQYVNKRSARFSINPEDTNQFCDKPTKFGLLDELMEQIPGKDNYNQVLYDTAFGGTIHRFEPDPPTASLNVANYHRWFQNDDEGAMDAKVRHRGFNDEHMWVAMNTQPHVLPTKVTSCPGGSCTSWSQRWSYAIPMEIVYTTPLHKWNPYNLAYRGEANTPSGQSVYDGPGSTVRDGTNHPDKAFDGTNSAEYYWLPKDFMTGPEIEIDPANTPKEVAYVLDQNNVIRAVRSSGIRAFLPEIPGVGILRQRYPIHPVYGEGSAVWKELSALSDIVMEPCKYSNMIRGCNQQCPP